jgi:hypothetical protein
LTPLSQSCQPITGERPIPGRPGGRLEVNDVGEPAGCQELEPDVERDATPELRIAPHEPVPVARLADDGEGRIARRRAGDRISRRVRPGGATEAPSRGDRHEQGGNRAGGVDEIHERQPPRSKRP